MMEEEEDIDTPEITLEANPGRTSIQWSFQSKNIYF
jgi:hypothetical protein